MRFYGVVYNQIRMSNELQTQHEGAKVILCIGESTTALGLGESYPAQLQVRLDQHYGKGTFSVINAGVPGSDTEKIKQSLDENLDKRNPDIVITMMGINDTWQLRGKIDAWYTKFQLYKLYKIAATNLTSYQEGRRKRAVAQAAFPMKKVTYEIAEGDKLMALKDYAGALEAYKKKLKADDVPIWVNFKIGIALLQNGQRKEAVPYFEKYLQSDYELEYMINIISMYYYSFGQFVRENHIIARQLAEKVLEKYPNNPQILRIAGLTYQQEDPEKAEHYLEKAVANGDALDGSYGPLGAVYKERKKFDKAEEILRKGIFSESDMGYFMSRDLIDLLLEQKKYTEAKKELEAAILRYPDNQTFVDYRLSIAEKMGEKIDESEVKDVVYWIKNFLKFPPTRKNYLEVAAKLRGKKIIHVAMQYPVRKIDELKEILKDYPDVIFIENKSNFETVLKSKKYDDVFSDEFGIDFGHFTLLGSTLVVDNVVVALEPVFESKYHLSHRR